MSTFQEFQYFSRLTQFLSDTVEARTKFLVIDELCRQLPFNKKPEAVNLNRQTTKLRKYMEGKFCETQVWSYNLSVDNSKLLTLPGPPSDKKSDKLYSSLCRSYNV